MGSTKVMMWQLLVRLISFIRHTTAEIQNMLEQDMFQLPSGLNACMQMIMETFAVLGMGICLLLLNPFMTSQSWSPLKRLAKYRLRTYPKTEQI